MLTFLFLSNLLLMHVSYRNTNIRENAFKHCHTKSHTRNIIPEFVTVWEVFRWRKEKYLTRIILKHLYIFLESIERKDQKLRTFFFSEQVCRRFAFRKSICKECVQFFVLLDRHSIRCCTI